MAGIDVLMAAAPAPSAAPSQLPLWIGLSIGLSAAAATLIVALITWWFNGRHLIRTLEHERAESNKRLEHERALFREDLEHRVKRETREEQFVANLWSAAASIHKEGCALGPSTVRRHAMESAVNRLLEIRWDVELMDALGKERQKAVLGALLRLEVGFSGVTEAWSKSEVTAEGIYAALTSCADGLDQIYAALNALSRSGSASTIRAWAAVVRLHAEDQRAQCDGDAVSLRASAIRIGELVSSISELPEDDFCAERAFALNVQGRTLVQLGEFDAALDLFSKVSLLGDGGRGADLDVQRITALYGKGSAYLRSHRLSEALQAYSVVSDRFADTSNPEVQVTAAAAIFDASEALWMLNRPEDAIHRLETLESKYENSTERTLQLRVARASETRGCILAELGRYKEALDAFDSAYTHCRGIADLDFRVAVVSALLHKAVTLNKMRLPDQAIQVYQVIRDRYAGGVEAPIRELVARALMSQAFLFGQIGQSARAVAIFDEIELDFKDCWGPELEGAAERLRTTTDSYRKSPRFMRYVTDGLMRKIYEARSLFAALAKAKSILAGKGSAGLKEAAADTALDARALDHSSPDSSAGGPTRAP